MSLNASIGRMISNGDRQSLKHFAQVQETDVMDTVVPAVLLAKVVDELHQLALNRLDSLKHDELEESQCDTTVTDLDQNQRELSQLCAELLEVRLTSETLPQVRDSFLNVIRNGVLDCSVFAEHLLQYVSQRGGHGKCAQTAADLMGNFMRSLEIWADDVVASQMAQLNLRVPSPGVVFSCD
ncbi:MAG: hypothetical protein MHM6MM_007045 [Cercozoa sp. M6MM]